MTEHRVVRLDVSDLSTSARRLLELLLVADEVRHDFRSGWLEVAGEDEAISEDLVERARREEPALDDEELMSLALGHEELTPLVENMVAEAPANEGAPARNGARFAGLVLGWLAWGIAWSVVALVMDWVAPNLTGAALRSELVVLVPVSALLTRTGTSPGAVLLSLEVEGLGGGRPSWVAAVLRALVLWGPVIVLNELAVLMSPSTQVPGLLAWVALLWLIALGLSIVLGPGGRGWHDRMSGTQVLRASSGTPHG